MSLNKLYNRGINKGFHH